MSKTNTGLVAYAKAQLGKPYWYGCFGNKSTKALYRSKKKQYPEQYQWTCPDDQLNKRVHDCIGLIKGYLWSDNETATPKYKASQDVSANGMLEKCTKKGKIETMPDVAGLLVFLPHHVGVYIGNGYVIEAKGHKYGVVKTKLAGRGWTHWGYCPWITYEDEKSSGSEKTNSSKVKTYSVTAKSGLNLRTAAGVGNKSICIMPYGSKVTASGNSKVINGVKWLEITYKGKTGYSSSQYLK